MAPRTHQLTRAALVASVLLLVLLGGVPADPAPGWALPTPSLEGTLHLDEAPAEALDALAPAAVAGSRLVAVLAGPAAVTLALVLRRRPAPGRMPWRPVPWPAPANRPPPLATG